MLKSVLLPSMPEELGIEIVDLFPHQTPEEGAALILAHAPRYVGLSIYVWNRKQAVATAALLKARDPGIIVFAGGPEVTADPVGMAAEAPIDYVLTGEGEEIIVPFMKALLAGAPPDDVRRSFIPTPVADLSTLPSPYLNGILDLTKYTSLLWEMSRGCAFKCSFCFEGRGTAGVRRFPQDRLRAELDLFEKHLVNEVFVLDPTFNYSKREAKEILRWIAERNPGMHFFFEVRTEFLDEEMAGLFAAIPCTLQAGMQSFDTGVLKNINRKMNRKDFEAKILLLHEAGVTYGFDLIFGLPGDTLDGFLDSLDFAMSLAPNHLDIFRLSVLPGTELYDTAPSFDLVYEKSPPYHIRSSPTFSAADLAVASEIADAFTLFYNTGKAVPWFAVVIEGLGLRPSQLIRKFAAFRKAHPSTDVVALQSEFLRAEFGAAGKAAQGRVALDLVTYFGRSSELLDAAAAPMPSRPLECVAAFHHDPEALLDMLYDGYTDLNVLAEELEPVACEASLAVADGDVALRIVSRAV